MNKISIKLKVVIWYTLIMVAISAVATAAMRSLGNEFVKRSAITRMTQAINMLSRAAVDARGALRDIPSFRFFHQGVFMALYDDENNLIGGHIPFEFSDDIPLEPDRLRNQTYKSNQYMTYVKKIQSPGGQSVWIKGVIPLSDENQRLASVAKTNLVLTVLLILTAALGGYYIINRAFKPVSKISRTAREICESSDLSQRIALEGGKDEIYQLAATFDEMLEKIEQTFAREKQFTDDASHELRTPVAVITSECEYVLDCAKTLDEAKESVVAVKRQADKMSKLIAELLTISRMEKNTQKVNFKEADISELLEFVCDEQEEIHDNGITLSRSIKPGIWAQADHFLLARLFMNLIGNAYQYGRENGRINVILEEDAKNLTATVADDGIGIAPEQLPKIWERFYQVDPARSSTETGSMGLGLAMVRQIADCHRGKIRVESTLGQGSRFIFTMPKNL